MCTNVEGNVKAISDTLYVIGGKWKLLILLSVCNGHSRFRDIERHVKGITTRMLSKELKELELNNLISRKVYDDSPVLVKYSPTAYAQTLVPVVQAMVDWGLRHSQKIRGK